VQPEQELRGGWLLLATIRLAAELGMLAAVAYAGWRLAAGSQALGLTLAVAFVAVAATVWGRWVAPRAQSRLEDPARLLVELVLFGAAVVGLFLLGQWPSALALGLAYVVSAPIGRRGH
jgi:hypothetical protein